MSAVIISHPTGHIKTSLALPSSKSISNRALVIRTLQPQIHINNLSSADDTRLMEQALTSLSPTKELKNAGTCMRFLTAYYAAVPGCDITLHGDERMKQRPISGLVDALTQIGAVIRYTENQGFPPLAIKGSKLSGGVINVDAAQSSQFATAIMLMAPYFERNSIIKLQEHVVSESYIDLTIALMQFFGADVSRRQNEIRIKSGHSYLPKSLEIEPDWSSAGYWYEVAALSRACEIFLEGLTLKSFQGDAIVAEWMCTLGVESIETDNGVLLKKTGLKNSSKQWDFKSTPDLAPTMAVTASALNNPSILSGLSHLAIKESNRIHSIKTELTNCGFHVAANRNSITLYATQRNIISKPVIETYADHRIAMSFAPLALLFDEIVINNPEVVEKSYPSFWIDMEKAGFILQFV